MDTGLRITTRRSTQGARETGRDRDTERDETERDTEERQTGKRRMQRGERHERRQLHYHTIIETERGTPPVTDPPLTLTKPNPLP